MKLNELEKQMTELGYCKGTSPQGLINSNDIDTKVCRESKCPKCRHEGLEFIPFIHYGINSYRAFAYCPKCGHVEEF